MPILPSWDFDATSEFFARIGFAEDRRFDDEYLILIHPVGIEIHFFHCTPFPAANNDHATYIRFSTADEAERLHAEWAAADLGHGKLTEPRDTSYGLREFSVSDPMHNLLRVGGLLS